MLTVCDPPRVSENVTEEVCKPGSVGLNVTPIRQLPPCGRMTLPCVHVVRFAPVPVVIKLNVELPLTDKTGAPPVGIEVDVFPAFVR